MKAELGALEWEVSYDAQKEYIDHLDFLLWPHLDKLPTDVVAEITAIPGECSMVVGPASRHAPKVTPANDATVADGALLMIPALSLE